MRYDLDQLPAALAYKLLTASVTPRPIAWVVTCDSLGVVNAAPFSFFNIMGAAPPVLALGLSRDSRRGLKDTARNILETGEFVVNLVPYPLAEAMNLTALDAPADVDELKLAGLTTAPSSHVRPPRIAENPVAMECRSLHVIETGPEQLTVLGRVLAMEIDDAMLRDPARGHIDTAALDLVGRAEGNAYTRNRDRFDLVRPTWDDWQKTEGE